MPHPQVAFKNSKFLLDSEEQVFLVFLILILNITLEASNKYLLEMNKIWFLAHLCMSKKHQYAQNFYSLNNKARKKKHFCVFL